MRSRRWGTPASNGVVTEEIDGMRCSESIRRPAASSRYPVPRPSRSCTSSVMPDVTPSPGMAGGMKA